jgi:hypothetical protein
MGLKSSKVIKSIRKDSIRIQDFQNNTSGYLFKEIVIFKDFEVGNGVLGLDRDVYLSIVKFLCSPILRKV